MALSLGMFFLGLACAWALLKSVRWLPVVLVLALPLGAVAGTVVIKNTGTTSIDVSYTINGFSGAGANAHCGVGAGATVSFASATSTDAFTVWLSCNCGGDGWHQAAAGSMGDQELDFNSCSSTNTVQPTNYWACLDIHNSGGVPLYYVLYQSMDSGGGQTSIGSQNLQPNQTWHVCVTNANPFHLQYYWLIPGTDAGGQSEPVGSQAGGTPGGGAPGSGGGGTVSGGDNPGASPTNTFNPGSLTNGPVTPPITNPFLGTTNPASAQGQQQTTEAIGWQTQLDQSNTLMIVNAIRALGTNGGGFGGSNIDYRPYFNTLSSNVNDNAASTSNVLSGVTNLSGWGLASWNSFTGTMTIAGLTWSNQWQSVEGTVTQYLANNMDLSGVDNDDMWVICPRTNILGSSGPASVNPKKNPFWFELAAVSRRLLVIIVTMVALGDVYAAVNAEIKKLFEVPGNAPIKNGFWGLGWAGATAFFTVLCIGALPIMLGGAISYWSTQGAAEGGATAGGVMRGGLVTGTALSQALSIFNLFVPWAFISGTVVWLWTFRITLDAGGLFRRTLLRYVTAWAVLALGLWSVSGSEPSSWLTLQNHSGVGLEVDGPGWAFTLADGQVARLPVTVFGMTVTDGAASLSFDYVAGLEASYCFVYSGPDLQSVYLGSVAREGLWDAHAPDGSGYGYYQLWVGGFATGLVCFGTAGMVRKFARFLHSPTSRDNL